MPEETTTAATTRPRWLAAGMAATLVVVAANVTLTTWSLTRDPPPATVARVADGPADEPSGPAVEGEVIALDSMTTTVGGAPVRHARMTMALVLAQGVTAEAVSERAPLLQDALLLELSQMSGEQIHSADGARELRRRMTDHAHDIWGADVVVRVVFTELVIP